MRRILLALLVLLTFTPAMAQTGTASTVAVSAPLPDNEALLQLAITRQQGQPTAANVGVAWLHNSGRLTTGAVFEILRHGDTGGAGLGPLLEARFAQVGSAWLFAGGDLTALLSDAADNAAAAGTGRIGARFPLAKDGHAAGRFTIEYRTPVGLRADGQPNDVKQIAVLFGISIGAKVAN